MDTSTRARHYQGQMRKDVGIAPATMSKLNKGEEVALPVLLRICEYLNCDIGDICETVRIEDSK